MPEVMKLSIELAMEFVDSIELTGTKLPRAGEEKWKVGHYVDHILKVLVQTVGIGQKNVVIEMQAGILSQLGKV